MRFDNGLPAQIQVSKVVLTCAAEADFLAHQVRSVVQTVPGRNVWGLLAGQCIAVAVPRTAAAVAQGRTVDFGCTAAAAAQGRTDHSVSPFGVERAFAGGFYLLGS